MATKSKDSGLRLLPEWRVGRGWRFKPASSSRLICHPWRLDSRVQAGMTAPGIFADSTVPAARSPPTRHARSLLSGRKGPANAGKGPGPSFPQSVKRESRVFNTPRGIATDGKRTRRRGLHKPRGRSIATPGHDPESRVFRQFLAGPIKDSGLRIQSGVAGEARPAIQTGIVESVNLPSLASGFPRPSGNDGPRHFRRHARSPRLKHCGGDVLSGRGGGGSTGEGGSARKRRRGRVGEEAPAREGRRGRAGDGSAGEGRKMPGAVIPAGF